MGDRDRRVLVSATGRAALTTCCDCGNEITARPGLCASVHEGLCFDAGCDADCEDETSIEGHGATPEAALADYRERVEGQRGLVACDACGRWIDHTEWRGSCCEDCYESASPSRPDSRKDEMA